MHVKSWMIYVNNQLMRTLLLKVHSFVIDFLEKEMATYSNILVSGHVSPWVYPILNGTLWASWTWVAISFSMSGNFSPIISSNIFSYPFFISSSSEESESEVAQSCVTLCDPIDCSPPGSSVHGILQARMLEWVAISFSRGSSRPRD